MTKINFKAAIFDLDGVITKTAAVHSAAWKKMFDNYLHERAEKYGEPFKEFTHENDYLPHVDGKPRYKGVDDFLRSRGIELPFGQADDAPEMETCCGLGNRKNKFFNQILEEDGVGVFEATVKLIRELIKNDVKIGVASSSKNCKPILEAAELLNLFETRVDGVVSAELKLKGKPEPDIFTVAADNLGIDYEQAIVFEDAVSGVQAGANGHFGLVVGIARENNEKELYVNGADYVVTDLEELPLNKLNKVFEETANEKKWSICYKDYLLSNEKSRESLLAIGNGYFGSRGSMEEKSAGENNYPGTYIAGLYNRLVSKVGDRDVENEDFVNCPNWTSVQFRIDNGDWIDPNACRILHIKRILHFKTGLLRKHLIIEDQQGRITKIVSQRFASMANAHLAALKYTIKPLNYTGKIHIQTCIDGDLINDGVERYRSLNQKHLKAVSEHTNENTGLLVVETTQSKVLITVASRQKIVLNNTEQPLKHSTKKQKTIHETTADLKQNQELSLEKTVAIFTSRDFEVSDPAKEAENLVNSAINFDQVFDDSVKEWEKIWQEADIRIKGDLYAQKLIRLHVYHMMISASPHNKNIDASFTARGLHGEAYRGHIFWDELFIQPFYNIHFPEVAKASLLYRYNRLHKAREYAHEYGYEGAMFPWQSGSDGREETQVVHLNPLTGEWGPDHSSLQRHVSLAVAFNVWSYYHTTCDKDFMQNYGIEMLLDICKFWVSKCSKNEANGRYSIDRVMGPDEFHEMYPNAKEGGLKDNAYTNLMVAWLLKTVQHIAQSFDCKPILSKINLTSSDLERWNDIAHHLRLVVNDESIIAQFDGYFELKELDWDAYRKKYGNVYRMDRILKAEGKSADDYKVAKQADTLMAFYNLHPDEVQDLLNDMNYHLHENYLQKNLEYYLERTSHGSTLSRVVHAQLAAMAGLKDLSWQLYLEALESDFVDIQGGTTAEGIHYGVMAGTVLIALKTYAGLSFRNGRVHLNPDLPKSWKEVSFGFAFCNAKFNVTLDTNSIKVSVNGNDDFYTIHICGKNYTIRQGESLEHVF